MTTVKASRKNPSATIADPALVPRMRPTVRNRAKLARFETALATKACPVITVLGNSISHGVGANGSSSTTNGYVEEYQQFAWPVLLRKLLAARDGQPPATHWIGLSRLFDYAENYQNGAASSLSVGPFGYKNTDPVGGGLSLPSTSASADIPASKTGRFTDLDVLCWGTASGTAGYRPKVLIDDVEVYAGGTVATGNLDVITISGLSDAAHKITLVGTGTNACFVAGVVARRASGIVVNKIANPGMQVTNVTGAEIGFTSQQIDRNVNAAICAGYTDLLIVQFTANEVYQQVSITNYTNNMQGIITRATAAGACVLLLGDPMVTGEEGPGYTIRGSQYRAVLQSLSDSNDHVAYADMNAIFGDRASGEAVGMWPSGTVHPALEGHRRMADFILHDVLPLPLISSTVGGPDDKPFTAAEKALVDGATTAATASTLAKRDANGNLTADVFVPGVTSTATAGGTTTLDADSVEVQIFTGSSGQTVVLPSAPRRFTIVNLSSSSLTLNASGGGNIGAVPTQNIVTVVAKQSTPTVAADWSASFSSTYAPRSSATSGTVAVRDGNANLLADNFIPTKAQITTSAGTTTLTIDSPQVQEHIGSTTHTTKLPTTGVTAGMSWIVPNNSSGVVTIQSSGGNTIDTVAAGTLKVFYALQDTPTTAAHWAVK